MLENVFVRKEDLVKKKTAEGIYLQDLGKGKLMSGFRWTIEDGRCVDWHNHPSEQFGFVIRGGFHVILDDGNVREEYTISAGDCYFLPPYLKHKFIAIGETEVIDIFNPIKEDIPFAPLEDAE